MKSIDFLKKSGILKLKIVVAGTLSLKLSRGNRFMEMKRYRFKITREHLEWLSRRAQKEHNDFFKRTPRLRKAYKKSLIGIVLCQGAALHYIDEENGIKDFDIWFFYKEDGRTRFSVRRVKTDKKGYKGIKIDFIKKAIPRLNCERFPKRPDQCILNYLRERNTSTKRFLLEKAGIGLYPRKIFAETIWETE